MSENAECHGMLCCWDTENGEMNRKNKEVFPFAVHKIQKIALKEINSRFSSSTKICRLNL